MNEIAESEPYKARKLHGCVPCVPELCAEIGFAYCPCKAVFHALLGLDRAGELHIGKFDLFPVADNDYVVNAVAALKEHGDIAV